MNLLGHLLERSCIRVDSDKELVWVRLGGAVDKESVAGPDVDHHSVAGMGEKLL